MTSGNGTVDCRLHGSRAATYVCQHLVSGENRGVVLGYDPDNPLTLYPDAWCNSCDAKLSEVGDWTDETEQEAGIRLLCSECYTTACARNWLEDSDAYASVIDECVERLQIAQTSLIEEYRLNDWERWDWEMEPAELVFSHEGERQVTANVVFIGSYSSRSGSWMWAWGNESLPDSVRTALTPVKTAADATGFRKLVQGYWKADEHEGWHMAAYALSVLGGLGGYRTPLENGHIYMVIRDASRD
jgi:hypothetical protein